MDMDKFFCELVANIKAHEYQRYISHPLNLPLVVPTEV